ncbi:MULTISPECIES: RidA family protein [Mesorhizobium]|uniref:RidA family protein n=1 Tax=Mesorhizobium TaxID=68287 RepID=UPI0017827926|nr:MULTISPECIES: Rid family detoxifying hydrolase [Mesorhizobium]MBM2715030.1 hypothetical protein [Mesorhizobium caraganae]
MTRFVTTPDAPDGPFSHAAVVGPWVFVSGMGGMDPRTREVVSDDIVEQTKQSLANVMAILKACDCRPDDIVKVVVYLTDMADYDRVNAVYLNALAPHKPARTCVAVSSLPARERMKLDVTAFSAKSS